MFSLFRSVLFRLAGRMQVISAVGIMTPWDAKRRLDMGAALVQIITGMVYAGPGLLHKIISVYKSPRCI